MRKLEASVYDDLDAAEGILTKADTTITIGWNGHWYEVDLTKEHAVKAEQMIAPYLRGKPLSEPPKPARRKPSPRGASLAQSRRDGAGMRAFADASKGRYRYKTYQRQDGSRSTYAYPDDLRAAYAAHLARRAEGATRR